jgi:HEAT repeat protein
VDCQLIDDLNSARVEVRRRAAEHLARHPGAGAATVSLVRACADSDEQVREWAVAALEELGAPSPEDVAALVNLVTAPCSDTAYWAATLLGRLGPPAAASVSQLTRVVESGADAAVRQRAVWALGRIGPAAAAAGPALKKAAAASDPRLARLAAAALVSIGRE